MGVQHDMVFEMPKKKAPSGRNIAEHERNTLRIVLRLDPEVAETLRAYAAAWKCPISEVVETALEKLSEHVEVGAQQS